MDLKIATPCQESWADMTGDERVRFCGRCSLHVYNLSELSEPEALALMKQSEGRACVRFFQRKDGTVLTKDCPVGRKRRWKVLASMTGLAALLLTGIAAIAVGESRSSGAYQRPPWLVTILRWLGQDEPPPMPTMGKPCPPTPPPAPTPKGT